MWILKLSPSYSVTDQADVTLPPVKKTRVFRKVVPNILMPLMVGGGDHMYCRSIPGQFVLKICQDCLFLITSIFFNYFLAVGDNFL
jgi:hypothetical protein